MTQRRDRSPSQVLAREELIRAQAEQAAAQARQADDFERTDLERADLERAHPERADLERADLVGSAEAPDADDDAWYEQPAPIITRRRLLRWTLLLTAGVLAVLACWQDPVYAHDGVKLTMHHDGKGSVWIDTAWADGHPISDPVAATLSARERAGSTVLPVALNDLSDGKGSARYAGTLKDGTWTVTVDVSKPGAGTCTAILVVGGAAAKQESVVCDDVAPAAQVAAARGDSAEGGNTSTTALLIGAGVVAVLFALVAAATFRRRKTTSVA